MAAQQERIDAPVGLPADNVSGQPHFRIPGLVPGDRACFQQRENAVCDDLVDGNFRLGRMSHGDFLLTVLVAKSPPQLTLRVGSFLRRTPARQSNISPDSIDCNAARKLFLWACINFT